jgi:chromosomal replication initiator protein
MLISGLDVWDRVQSRLREQIQGHSFDAWIRPLSLLSADEGEIMLGVPNSFFLDWIETHYRSAIEECAAAELTHPVKIALTIHEVPHLSPDSDPRDPAAPARPAVKTAAAAIPSGPSSGLNHRHTFETFVVGRSNNFAYAAAQAVAEQPGMVYNPLFIYGGVGLGKTHILHAIRAHALERDRNLRVVYVTGEDFTNLLIKSIQRGRAQDFKSRYRTVDILLIDDIHFLRGKETTQEEFFHTFNTLHQAQRQLVMTSDRPPKELNGLEDRLISRFGWGLVADIQPPDLETRTAILRKFAEYQGMPLADDVAMLIAQNIKTNIRDLEGCLTRLLALSRNHDQPLDFPFAERALEEFMRSQRRALSPRRIQEVVAQIYEVGLDDLRGKIRTNAVALPRQVTMYLMREHTGLSFSDIGRELGNRDHTTVMHGCTKIATRLTKDAELRAHLAEINRVLGIQNGR